MATGDTKPEGEAPLHTIKIMGNEYRVRSDSNAEHLEEVATYLDGVLRGISESTSDTQDAVVLAALNLASEVLQLRQLEAVPRGRLQALIDLVDSA